MTHVQDAIIYCPTRYIQSFKTHNLHSNRSVDYVSANKKSMTSENENTTINAANSNCLASYVTVPYTSLDRKGINRQIDRYDDMKVVSTPEVFRNTHLWKSKSGKGGVTNTVNNQGNMNVGGGHNLGLENI